MKKIVCILVGLFLITIVPFKVYAQQVSPSVIAAAADDAKKAEKEAKRQKIQAFKELKEKLNKEEDPLHDKIKETSGKLKEQKEQLKKEQEPLLLQIKITSDALKQQKEDLKKMKEEHKKTIESERVKVEAPENK